MVALTRTAQIHGIPLRGKSCSCSLFSRSLRNEDFRCNSTNRASLSTGCRSVQVVALIASGKKIFLLRVVRRVNKLMKLSDVQMAYFLCDKLMLRFSLTWYHLNGFLEEKIKIYHHVQFYVIYLPLKFALKYIMMGKTCLFQIYDLGGKRFKIKSLVKSC